MFNRCFIWEKIFKNGPSKICGRQSLKNFTLSILEYFVPYKETRGMKGLVHILAFRFRLVFL